METSFSFYSFHADKAIVTFKDPTQAALLCNNNEWSTLGRLILSSKLAMLVGAFWMWLRKQRLEQILWKPESKLDTIILASNISIKDDNGHPFVVQTVTHENKKWLTERDVKIHGSFQRKVAIDFDDFNPKAEQYYFIGNTAVPPEKIKLKSKIVINELSHSSENLTMAKIIDDKGSKGSKDSDGEMANKKEKRKGKEICLLQSINEDMEGDSHSMQTKCVHEEDKTRH
ncbi:hypothetical protein E5676_scaffold680G001040 [Cucumis melo var. makuwa]|uniref:Uncharacterized protein n=1 Tax=Cucumis melo var. makuwa TaxID=1194695 RepID=A0A5D3BSG0_CUCMM|nr:hypothetical protein E6C27_scaffold243G00120 [Cucumis melo var. makuwa]TYK02115.1 hypothetical protein E5676_scaffold680G001040 [Cucumis melo var. makuwa]